ncbi:probable serine/threonine-protein kinase DDB_G0282963 [Musca vetustissima]|uniref:probable serine/threonine-protein kinase DDB_G0282963 n=1 Tax=Musca vetustissima TaxID=27455 RepID=UPI002AB7A23E|nr:probable serine/threonine-protein kinase DDB_G0282963 [Musca vetustissima]
MESNEISMLTDIKLDIYDKRPLSLKFKAWTRCEVKIEAIKCLPCFLRITIKSLEMESQQPASGGGDTQLCVSVNVPGVSISLATSRTKQFSYGLFWTHNRRDCFIYFAEDTEATCRKHMKWIKKSIKNLEVYRQVFFEQRRSSRAGTKTLGPLPQIPISNNSFNWSGGRLSRASEIYEEIFEGNIPPRLSRRLSRASIASGIYEEMKPCSQSIINAIMEEHLDCPPPLPPLPPHRKRINTLESEMTGSLNDIPRSNTNPEVDLAKKKKYKNVLDNIFGTGRSKRAESVSESQACTMEDIINGSTGGAGGHRDTDKDDFGNPLYANEILKRPEVMAISQSKRNSFSSPDLSKINFLDTFDEEKIAALLLLQSSSNDELEQDHEFVEVDGVHNYSSLSLDDSSIGHCNSRAVLKRLHALKSKSGSLESLNISEQLPQNFNFSACNTSSINLVGASGAVPSLQIMKRNKIVIEDDLTGYCIMAPIQNKKTENRETTNTATSSTTSSTSSGYSTGSYCSTTSSSSSSNSEPTLRKTPIPVNDSNIYENMQVGSPLNASIILKPHEHTPPLNKDFSGNLYENLLTIKAAQELEQPMPVTICTSTPTDSASEKDSPAVMAAAEEHENYYQTPRKSIISIDDKVPSYYPNSCDTMKMKRGSKSSHHLGLKHLVNIKMRRERKENLYISSPQKIMDQRKKSSNQTTAAIGSGGGTSTIPRRTQNAQKISENVYTVNINKRRSLMLNTNNNNNNNTEKSSYNDLNDDAVQLKEQLQTELLQLALLQNIDFKFDDTINGGGGSMAEDPSTTNSTPNKDRMEKDYNTTPKQSGIRRLEEAELEYENCYKATKDATRLLHKYATLAPKQSMRIKQQLQQHLKNNPKDLMTQSAKLESSSSPVSNGIAGDLSSTATAQVMGTKKFGSLPRFKKIDFSPLKFKINNVLQRNQHSEF